jgi:acyl CoA:acetate/3-ketoacid CoA transferase alpha subunit
LQERQILPAKQAPKYRCSTADISSLMSEEFGFTNTAKKFKLSLQRSGMNDLIMMDMNARI